MYHLNSIKAAAKGKAPIVALPVEGSAPVCVDRKRLAGWSKGVTITRVEVVTHYTFSEPSVPYDVAKNHPRGAKPEGPAHRLPGNRSLVIEGTAGRVKTSCRMVAIDRRTAVKTLGAWSEKERARQLKKTMLGALSKQEKTSMKLAAFDDAEGAGMVPVMVAHKQGFKRQALGIPVTLPAFPGEFILHRSPFDDDSAWVVTEVHTGQRLASGTNQEAALLEARTITSKLTPAQRAKGEAAIAEAKQAAQQIAA
jgi:hypothetical protein